MSQARIPLVFRVQDDQSVERTKFSDLLLEFARPLMNAMQREIRDADSMAKVLEMATMCWNAPEFARTGEPKPLAAMLQAIEDSSGPVQRGLRTMLESRVSGKYQQLPLLLRSDVEERENGELLVHAFAVSTDTDTPTAARSTGPRIGPNERCPCGSGRKYKRCCRTRGSAPESP
jgi:uncharacterized protein YecA (UPF0149 family)